MKFEYLLCKHQQLPLSLKTCAKWGDAINTEDWDCLPMQNHFYWCIIIVHFGQVQHFLMNANDIFYFALDHRITYVVYMVNQMNKKTTIQFLHSKGTPCQQNLCFLSPCSNQSASKRDSYRKLERDPFRQVILMQNVHREGEVHVKD